MKHISYYTPPPVHYFVTSFVLLSGFGLFESVEKLPIDLFGVLWYSKYCIG